MRVASYVRVSTMQQVHSQTIEQQVDRIYQHVREQGWKWCSEHIFRDDGYSGATLKRPGLDQLRDKVALAYFDVILVTAPDRLARKYVHQMVLIDEFGKSGCAVAFLDRPISDDPNDQLLLQIRGAVAEYERTLIAERLRRGRQYKYRTGQLLPWTKTPYGYLGDPDKPRVPESIRLHDSEAAIVREIYAQYLAPGGSLSSVAKWLTSARIPSPSGLNRWRPQTIRMILTNPVYTGKVFANRTKSCPVQKRRSPLRPIGSRPSSEIPRPPEERTFVGNVPAIVSQELFEQAREKLAHNKLMASRNNKTNSYLLRSLVSCGLCQRTCRGRTRRKYAYYQCAGKDHLVHRGDDHRCLSRLVPVKQLDELVWNDLCHILTHPEVITGALKRAQSGAWLSQELQARRENVRKANRRLSNQVERLTEAYLAGILGLDEYQRRRSDLEQQIVSLEKQMHQIEQEAGRQAETIRWITNVEKFSKRVRIGLEQANFEQRRRLVKLLIDRVVVTGEDIEIRYVIPVDPRAENTRFCQLRQDYYVRVLSRLAWLDESQLDAMVLDPELNLA